MKFAMFKTKEYKSKWHKWFAWYPVKVAILDNGKTQKYVWAWLETVEARLPADSFFWEYRLCV